MLHTHPGSERPPQNVTDHQNTFAERDGDLPSSTGSLCPIWDRRASSRPCNIWDSGQICCWASIFFFVKCLYFIFCAGSPWWPQRCRNTRWLLDRTWRHVNWKSLCSEGEKEFQGNWGNVHILGRNELHEDRGDLRRWRRHVECSFHLLEGSMPTKYILHSQTLWKRFFLPILLFRTISQRTTRQIESFRIVLGLMKMESK